MTVKQRVKVLLERFEKYRDNDLSLISHIWNDQIEHTGIRSSTAFLKYHASGKLIAGDVITRARRQLQEQHPELRGKTYNLRQGIRQEEKKRELGYK